MDHIDNPGELADATSDALEEMLMPRVDVGDLAAESDIEKLEEVAFELYKEALSVVNLVAHIVSSTAAADGGWPRNQAICAGLLVRISKFMLVVVQLSAKGDRAEVVAALNRCILESAINLEFLARGNDDRFFDQFVKLSLGPERELHDLIQSNIAARKGEVWPIEERMLKSIHDLCSASGVRIEDINRRSGDWGGGLRERLRALNREEQYASMVRMPSHAVHGTWVDLYKSHLEVVRPNVYIPSPNFSWVDERSLGPIAILVLDATKPYLEKFFSEAPETALVFGRIEDLQHRIIEVGAAHEGLFVKRRESRASS